mgnify:CR=1 FL=1
MNIFADFRTRIENSIHELINQGVIEDGADLSRISVEPPREESHGDMATNAAMVLGKFSELQPRDLASKIAELLSEDEEIASIDIAGPGFINLSLAPSVWQGQVAHVLKAGTGFGNSDIGADKKVNVEYVSANPTGPMHVGHARGAVVGDALARLLERANYKVTREYYINDAGSQIDTLARSALIRMREALGEDIGDIPEGLYPGDYLVGVGQALAEEYGASLLEKPEAEQIVAAKSMSLPMMMEMIRDDLDALGVRHDVFLSEQSITTNLFKTPTCGAASPIPLLLYITCSISSNKFLISLFTSFTGFETSSNLGSGAIIIFKLLIIYSVKNQSSFIKCLS